MYTYIMTSSLNLLPLDVDVTAEKLKLNAS